jgi:glucosamine--fructose-6-phosphate aminotransferase (isomerizing)
MSSQLAREARQAADGARLQIARCRDAFAELGRRLAARPPAFVVTCARGSSDHAATYGQYLVETALGRAVASLGPSVASQYARDLVGVDGALFVAVSQSGRSPDLVELTEAARRGGALVVAMVNDETSPLAAAAEHVFPLCAGEERSVAATKSFLLAGVAFIQLAAAWSGDAGLRDAVDRAADALDAAAAIAWDLRGLAAATSAYVVGRGIGLGAALEIALKLKETCRLHAEAFSTAEVLHGPVALVEPGFPVIALAQADPTAAHTREVVARLAGLGARVWSTGAELAMPSVPAVLAPLCAVQSFYMSLPDLAAARGLDADAPVHLRKVTETR